MRPSLWLLDGDRLDETPRGFVASCHCGRYRSKPCFFPGYAESRLREHQAAKGCRA